MQSLTTLCFGYLCMVSFFLFISLMKHLENNLSKESSEDICMNFAKLTAKKSILDLLEINFGAPSSNTFETGIQNQVP